MPDIGILNPGAMGSSVAGAVRQSGRTVYWVSEGRSAESRGRAEKTDLTDAGTLNELVKRCRMILSVCPPEFAPDVAGSVSAAGFKGIYVDANAISPGRSRGLGESLETMGISYVDGGIIGGPDFSGGRSFLYLSGPHAASVPEIFEGSDLHVVVLDGPLGAASALKMCYAAWTKGTKALLGGILALAEQEEVGDTLLEQWQASQPALYESAEKQVRQTTAKAWRFAGEMEEIADTFLSAGLPEGFHRAAAEIYRRQARFKGAPELPSLDDIIRAVLKSDS